MHGPDNRITFEKNRLKGEATGIQFYPNNMNRQDWFSLSRSWKPLIHSLKERKTFMSKTKSVTSS
jgi:hypothetical protein